LTTCFYIKYHVYMLEILTIGEETLRKPAQPVDSFGSELKLLADAMIDTMHEDGGIGLAAPQIGVPKRLFVVHLQDEDPRVFVNPEIIETSQETCVQEEGCLSIPGVYADVHRPEGITLQARDVAGKVFTLTASGMLARVIQHEYDHLRGVLFIDRLGDEQREKILRIYEKRQRKRKKRV